jgi:hypothetical protein
VQSSHQGSSLDFGVISEHQPRHRYGGYCGAKRGASNISEFWMMTLEPNGFRGAMSSRLFPQNLMRTARLDSCLNGPFWNSERKRDMPTDRSSADVFGPVSSWLPEIWEVHKAPTP